MPYVFGYYPKSGNISGAFGALDFKLADLIERYGTNFARTGSPNGSGLPNWPNFGQSQSYIAFKQDGNVITNGTGLRRAQCDIYRELLKQRLANR